MKKKVIIWIVSFLLALVFLIFKFRFFGKMYSKGLNWEGIYEDKYMLIFYAALIATGILMVDKFDNKG